MQSDPDDLFKQAKILEALGNDDQAQDAYFSVLDVDRRHFGALNNLGNLFARRGLAAAALAAYREAIKWHPENAAAHVNLGASLLDADDLAAARAEFEVALQLDGGSAEAHQGLSAVFTRLGDDAEARRHRVLGFRDRALVTVPHRGERPALATVLLLLSATGGNVDLRHILDDHRFTVVKLFADVCDPNVPLPPHDLVFNAIGDAELCGEALATAENILMQTQARVLNQPDAVRATDRASNARRLGAIPGVIAPRIEPFVRTSATRTLAYPFLLRSAGHHSGAHMLQVRSDTEMHDALQRLPGSDLLAMEFLDARGRDGMVRKYRVMIVGGELYPLHLAISSNWMVHYFAAENASNEAYRAEEALFLDDMSEAIGAKAIGSLERVRDVLALDYGGIDFGLDRDGNVLLFEANATMMIPQEPPEAIWAYRRAPIHRVLDAVESMLVLAASVTPSEVEGQR